MDQSCKRWQLLWRSVSRWEQTALTAFAALELPLILELSENPKATIKEYREKFSELEYWKSVETSEVNGVLDSRKNQMKESKVSEWILAQRLGYLAETTNLLPSTQIGGRRKKLAVDATLLLIDEIEQNRQLKRITTTLFLDVKGVFDHVAKNQLLAIPQRLRLPTSLIAWVTTKTCSVTALQQSLIHVTLLFIAIGGVLFGFTSNYIGRRGTCQLGCFFIIADASGMIGSAGSFLNYMISKCISGIGMGLLYSAAPTWGSECISQGKRGLLLSLYNVSLGSDNIITATIYIGSSKLASNWSWRTPIIVQIPVGIILAAGSMLFPESPRWLLVKKREGKAWKSFASFYNKDPNSAAISWQIQETTQHIELQRGLRESTSWTEIFKGIDLRRTHVAVLALLGIALAGVQFVIPYTVLFLVNVGVRNPYILNVVVSTFIIGGSASGPVLCEYSGRRRTMLGSFSGMAICMLSVSAIVSGPGQTSNSSHITLVVFMSLWAFFFGATIGPVGWVASAEMHCLRLRTVGQSYAVGIYEIFSFGAAFWTPYMLNTGYGNMGTNVGYFYCGITVVVFALTYFFVPETGRLSLKQIDENFMGNIPAYKASLCANIAVVAENRRERSEKTDA